RPGWRGLLAGALLVTAIAGAFVALDLARAPGTRTHVGELAARALEGGWGRVAEIVTRKGWTNVEMALSPYFIGGLAAVTPLLWLWYHKLGEEAWGVLRARPLLKAAVFSAGAGAVAALLFNDTGVVAWAIATGCALFLWWDLLVQQRLVAHR
ncbi:MAG TPA: hypothetical protein VK689_23445, partial [Armatimonadota bacterium]|nr:hypothetical protein [Armatimonadota bacterium]